MKKRHGVLNCIWAAFSTYSRIPVPEAEWNEEGLRWQICCFPLVGFVIGLIWCAAAVFLCAAGAHAVLTGAVLCALPVLLSGGIHLDGFLDTSDALHSWKSPEERQNILKDPHIGAFALIYGALYLLLYFGLAVQLAFSVRAAAEGARGGFQIYAPLVTMWWGFVLSRVLSGLSVVYFPKARRDGMLRAAADAADTRAGRILAGELVFMILVIMCSAWLFKCPVMLMLPPAGGLVMLAYYRLAMKQFGGVSGDLAGWFLQITEIAFLACAVFTALLLR